MVDDINTDFCTECRKKTEYALIPKKICENIRGKTYQFEITVAECAECGAEMNPPGLIDRNIREMNQQYRDAEGIVTEEDIKELMEIYGMGETQLSLALGFEESAISRYLSGQIPTKENSEIMRSALSSSKLM